MQINSFSQEGFSNKPRFEIENFRNSEMANYVILSRSLFVTGQCLTSGYVSTRQKVRTAVKIHLHQNCVAR